MSDPVVLVGDQAREFDPEEDSSNRLAVGRLGDEVQSRWMCTGCGASPCVAYVESYRSARGMTFALCETCLWKRLDGALDETQGGTPKP